MNSTFACRRPGLVARTDGSARVSCRRCSSAWSLACASRKASRAGAESTVTWPRVPSTTPAARRDRVVASRSPTTAGMPERAASNAVWYVREPASVAIDPPGPTRGRPLRRGQGRRPPAPPRPAAATAKARPSAPPGSAGCVPARRRGRAALLQVGVVNSSNSACSWLATVRSAHRRYVLSRTIATARSCSSGRRSISSCASKMYAAQADLA